MTAEVPAASQQRAALEAACLEGLIETPHGYRYRPALGADAVERILADRAAAEDHGLRARLTTYVWESQLALRAATTIGERSCRDGDHLNYGNHDRLISEAARLRAALGGDDGGSGEGES